jgi:hypothetical protein
MRWTWMPLLLVMGCTPAWERHKANFAQREADGRYDDAVEEAKWLIENASDEAPPEERTMASDTKRQLDLSRVAAKSGDSRLAIEALRGSLMNDSNSAAAVGQLFSQLPLDPATRARFQGEFGWNTAALAPDEARLPTDPATTGCWSYHAREVRIRHNRTVKTADGPERQVTYDARLWTFDAATHRWRAAGNWVTDAGAATELVGGPPAPRYRAVLAADHGFYTEERVPACHRESWQGPFLENGTLFVSPALPAQAAAAGD